MTEKPTSPAPRRVPRRPRIEPDSGGSRLVQLSLEWGRTTVLTIRVAPARPGVAFSPGPPPTHPPPTGG